MRRLAVPALACMCAPAAAQEPPYLREIYRVSETGAAFAWSIDQTVSIAAPSDAANPKRWIAERHRTEDSACEAKGRCRIVTHDWIDGDDCPQLVAALSDLARIPVPSFAGSGRITAPYSDHASTVTIIGRPQPVRDPAETRAGDRTIADIMVRTQFGRFHDWWQRTEAALTGCWRTAAPMVGGKPARIEAPKR